MLSAGEGIYILASVGFSPFRVEKLSTKLTDEGAMTALPSIHGAANSRAKRNLYIRKS